MVLTRERDAESTIDDRRERTERQPEQPSRAPSPSEDRERDRPLGERNGQKQPAKKRSRLDILRAHPFVAACVAIVALAAVAGGIAWWLHARHFESTDDAFIDTRIATISSQVSGQIVDLAVTDNQDVEAGAVLAKIDDRDYRSAVAQANAQVEQAAASVANFDAQINAQNTRVAQARDQAQQAQAALTFAKQEDVRKQDLYAKAVGTRQAAEQTSSNLRQAQSSQSAAQANETAAEKQIAVLRTQRAAAAGQLDQARAALTQAQTNLARTRITAPVAGHATKISVSKGNFAQPGQALMMFVPREVWVTANFKETQLTDMRPGQPVDIEVDTYPGRTFHGHVDSLQSGSGNVFSLLPAENATGNFVKIVQRVPVKIVFDQPPDVFLGPGMSTAPSVRVR